MWTFLGKMMDRIFIVISALLFAQFPLFMQQYTIRLAGHVEELQYQVQLLRETATYSGKTLEEYIHKFISSSDMDFSRQGDLMFAMAKRLDNLSEALISLTNASALSKPFIFLYYSDPSIVNSTFWSFKVGLTLTMETAIYVVVGIFIGYYFYQIIGYLFGRISAGFKRAWKVETK